MPEIKIHPEQIPKIEMRLLASTFLDAVERFYEDPANRQAFQKWQRERATIT